MFLFTRLHETEYPQGDIVMASEESVQFPTWQYVIGGGMKSHVVVMLSITWA